MYTKPLRELTKNDSLQAGGKGASLGEMFQNNLPVPDGFVVLAQTFDSFLSETDLTQEIESILSSVNTDVIHTVESVSERIQSLILNCEFPEHIAAEINEMYKKLGAHYVAVRSSATAEDGAEHAWAGQLSSFLNIDNTGLLQAVQACWASLFTPRAIFYRFEKKLHDTSVSVAVVVQKMVQSEKSGVAFSVHPITEDDNQIIIEAGFGLGEAIVSGEITPDSYVVTKDTLSIIDININTQTKALYRSAHSHNGEYSEWRELSKEESISQVLSEAEIVTLSKLICKIENHYGFACDIEWAFEKEQFFITQSRPITTLGKKPLNLSPRPSWEKIWEAGNAPIFEMTHGTVLSHTTQQKIGPVDSEMAVVGSPDLISAYYTTQSLKQSGLDGLDFYTTESNKFFNEARALIGKANETVARVDGIDATSELFSETSQLLRTLFAYFNVTNPQFTYGLEAEVRVELQKYVGEALDEVMGDLCVSSDISLLQKEQIDWASLVITLHESGSKNIQTLIQKHFNTYKYLVGDEGNEQLTITVLSQRLTLALEEVEKFRHELSQINSYSDKVEQKKQAHIINYALPAELTARCKILAEVGHIRLELRSAWTAAFHILRKQLKQLASVHKLEHEQLLAYTADEIIDILNGEKKLEARPQKFSVVLKDGSWSILFGDQAVTRDNLHLNRVENNADTISGNVAYPGLVTGRVVRIMWGDEDMDEKISDFPEGGILVAGQTRPMLVPAIKRAAAIVTDEGGITSHAAIVAREFSKPCIIGTKIATEVLADGDLIEVDASRGLVTILERSSASDVNPDDYIRMFSWQSLSYLVSDLFMWHYRPLGVLSIHDEVSWMSLFPKVQLPITQEEGRNLYINKDEYQRFKNDFFEYMAYSARKLDEILSQSAITGEAAQIFLDLIVKHWSYYAKTEFFFTDLVTEANLSVPVADFDELKLKGRAHLNFLIFEESGYLSRFIAKINQQTSVSSTDLMYYSVPEIISLVDSNSLVSNEELNKRRVCYFASNTKSIFGEAAQPSVKRLFNQYREVANIIKGTIANSGYVRGKARVLVPDAKDFSAIAKEVEEMQLGEILIAETTSPEIIQACKKAAGIVTNQGGMLSHAAIIARELNIPCVIGTDKDVILSIKTGDTVEVDATKGIVSVIK